MAIDRAESRRRVRAITGWAAAGAAALTAGLAFGASRGSNAAQAPSAAAASEPATPQETLPEAPQTSDPQVPQDNQGFSPPSASTGPPAGMSGGS
jgi:hypothetical protein